jgi:hypothetical protein
VNYRQKQQCSIFFTNALLKILLCAERINSQIVSQWISQRYSKVEKEWLLWQQEGEEGHQGQAGQDPDWSALEL